MAEIKTVKRLTGGIATLVTLALCLCLTTFALVYAGVSVDNNLFGTAEVKINLNDGQPLIRENDLLFEPGMTVKKDFFIENQSTLDVYYKIYFTDVSGGLADVLTVTVMDGDETLYAGSVAGLTRENVSAAKDALGIGQRRNLTAYFSFPEESGNEMQKNDLTFTVCAEATQTKNNPDRLFD